MDGGFFKRLICCFSYFILVKAPKMCKSAVAVILCIAQKNRDIFLFTKDLITSNVCLRTNEGNRKNTASGSGSCPYTYAYDFW